MVTGQLSAMTPDERPPRWRYRFRNFSRAFALLHEAAEDDPSHLSDLEREGLIQRFEYTFELAWKTLKYRLEHDGVRIATITPRNVIQTAFAAKMIDDGSGWIDMLTDRNAMSHEYDSAASEEVADNVHSRYLDLFAALRERLAHEEGQAGS